MKHTKKRNQSYFLSALLYTINRDFLKITNASAVNNITFIIAASYNCKNSCQPNYNTLKRNENKTESKYNLLHLNSSLWLMIKL